MEIDFIPINLEIDRNKLTFIITNIITNIKSCSNILECPIGYWGSDCANSCYCNDTNELCSADNGTCESGCQEMFVGPACNLGNVKLCS